MIDAPVSKINHVLTAEPLEIRSTISAANMRVKRNLALPHIKNAAKRAMELRSIEQANAAASFGPVFDDMQAEWLSSIVSSAAAGEAYVNELIDRHKADPEKPIWAREKITKKFKTFAKSKLGRDVDLGSKVFQEMDMVCSVRHAVMHFRPFFDNENVESAKLEGKLPKLKTCFLLRSNEPFFPMRIVSSAYAIWAVEATLEFIRDIDDFLGEDRFGKHFARVQESLQYE